MTLSPACRYGRCSCRRASILGHLGPRLGRDPRSGAYHDADRHDGLELPPNVLITRVDGPLFFADADRFRVRLRELVRESGGVTGVVIDAESIHLSDTDGADMLIEVAGELRSQGARLVLAMVHPRILELWKRAGVLDAVGADGVFASVRDAVAVAGGSGRLIASQPHPAVN